MRKYISEENYTVKEYRSLAQFGATDDMTIEEYCLLTPANSRVILWTNETRYHIFHDTINAFLQKEYGEPKHGFGLVTIERFNEVWKIKWQSYNNNCECVKTYTTVNKKQGSDWSIIVPWSEVEKYE